MSPGADRYVKALATWAALWLLAIGSVDAQSTHGAIRGTVFDDLGLALDGVTIVVTSDHLQGERTVTTNPEGKFRLELLPPGLYKAVCSKQGYQWLEHEQIRVRLGGTVLLTLQLAATDTEEFVVAGGSPTLDRASAGIVSSFGQPVLNEIPVARDVSSIALLVPGVVEGGGLANDVLTGNLSIMGGSMLSNSHFVDQLDATDVADGRFGVRVPTSFVEELQVRAGSNEVEFGSAWGGTLNVITKSGRSEFRGELFGYYVPDGLTGTPQAVSGDHPTKRVESEFDVGFTLAGSLLRDKLWYFVGFDPSTIGHVYNSRISRADQLDAERETWTRTTKTRFFGGKLTWRVDKRNTASVTVFGDPTEVENQHFDTGRFYDSNLVDQTNILADVSMSSWNLAASWNTVLSDTSLVGLTVGRHRKSQLYTPQLEGLNYKDETFGGVWTDGVGQGTYFGAAGLRRALDRRVHDQIRGSLTWFLGADHAIKLGAGYSALEYEVDSSNNGKSDELCAPAIKGPNPWFDMEGPVGMDPGTGEYFEIPLDCDSNGDSINDGVVIGARSGNSLSLQDGYYVNRSFSSRSTGRSSLYHIFLQDEWTPTDGFTVSLGIRTEASEVTGDLSDVLPGHKINFSFADQLAPRMGLLWDPTRTGRMKVFAQHGRFFQTLPLNINVRAFGNEQRDSTVYLYRDDGSLPSPSNPGELFFASNRRSEHVAVDPDLRPQYLDQSVVGFEYEVMTDLAFGVKYISRSLGRMIEDISLDDGRTFFIANPGAYYDYNYGAEKPLEEPVHYPAAKRDYSAVEFTLSKRFSGSWQAQASLLWSSLRGNWEGFYSRDSREINPSLTRKFDLPDLLINADGILQNDRPWQFRAFGSYTFDFGMVLGANMFYLTGSPLSKLGAHPIYGLDERFVTRRGSEGRTEGWMNWDLHVSYPFSLGAYQLEAIFDVFNIFNEQVAVEVDQRWTVYGPGDEADAPGGDIDTQTNDAWSSPLVNSPPRKIRMGLKLSW
ncbi:MAG: TonB-dependent receptor [bacterium]|nr:TonB-dependent receptor [bacterium]